MRIATFLTLILSLYSKTLATVQGHDDVIAPTPDICEPEELNKRTHDLLAEYEPYYLPYLPWVLNLNVSDVDASISVSLAELTMKGFSDVSFTHSDLTIANLLLNPIQLNLTFNEIDLIANKYTAGGHVLNIPFAGKSNFKLGVKGLLFSTEAAFKVVNIVKKEYCFKNNFTIGLDQLIVNFANINPGEDSGTAINNVLSSFGEDIIAVVGNYFNDDFTNLINFVFVNVLGQCIVNASNFINELTICEE